MPSIHPSSINKATFDSTLARYCTAAPEKLHDLDLLRYVTIPNAVAERKAKQSIETSLDKGEVEKLVEWKLKHGTFRPKLLQLVQSNDAKIMQSVTLAAFSVLQNPKSTTSSETTPLAAMKTLTALKGIGPATASLLMSVHSPDEVPFFSDELYRWILWDEGGASGGGWKRKIGYTLKEYKALLEGVQKLRKRLGVRAVDAEKVAWVLGREGADMDVEEKGEGKEEVETVAEEGKDVELPEDATPTIHPPREKESGNVKKGTKRKAADTKPRAEGIRRSGRRKIA